MEITTAAYLAGLLDARGSFSIGRIHGRGGPHGTVKHATHTPMLLIRTSNPDLLSLLQAVGGTVSRADTTTAVSFPKSALVELLKEVIPFMRLQKQRAELLLDLVYLKSHCGPDAENLYARFISAPSSKVGMGRNNGTT